MASNNSSSCIQFPLWSTIFSLAILLQLIRTILNGWTAHTHTQNFSIEKRSRITTWSKLNRSTHTHTLLTIGMCAIWSTFQQVYNEKYSFHSRSILHPCKVHTQTPTFTYTLHIYYCFRLHRYLSKHNYSINFFYLKNWYVYWVDMISISITCHIHSIKLPQSQILNWDFGEVAVWADTLNVSGQPRLNVKYCWLFAWMRVVLGEWIDLWYMPHISCFKCQSFYFNASGELFKQMARKWKCSTSSKIIEHVLNLLCAFHLIFLLWLLQIQLDS